MALEELPGISAETDELLGRAKEFYELCPDAAAQVGTKGVSPVWLERGRHLARSCCKNGVSIPWLTLVCAMVA